MTSRRNIIIAVGAIVLFAAMVGFFITLDVAPQIAYARLFIDVGLIIGLVAVIMALYREIPLPMDGLVQALKALQNGKYKTRITVDEKDPLKVISSNINELAAKLEHQFRKQEEIKKSLREELLPGIKQKEPTLFEHSFHPELGPVCNLMAEQQQQALKKELKEKFEERANVQPIKKTEQIFNNSLLDSNPPPKEMITQIIEPALDRQDQDLGELFQRFVEAQRANNLQQIEYPLFLKTIEKTRNDLLASHHCQGVVFDVVREADEVALQPRIIR